MKKLFSLVLGGLVLIGGATLGLQSANAAARTDNHHKHHHHKHHHHHHYRQNKLSY